MNVRIVPVGFLLLFFCSSILGQPAPARGNSVDSYREDLLHRIAVVAEGARQAERDKVGDIQLARIYAELGQLCYRAAQWDRSESAAKRSLLLFRRAGGAKGELAVVLSQLADVHIAKGNLKESEKEDKEALKLREELGDRLQIARSWEELSALALRQQRFQRAKEFAQKAVEEFSTNTRSTVSDRMAAWLALSESLCGLNECPSAIPFLKKSVDDAKAALRPQDFPIGLSEFLLGYAYWKSGEISLAEEYMRDGTSGMDKQLGWGHPAYVAALTHYEKFLKENRQMEAANEVERKIHRAEAVVDVGAIQSGQGAFGFAALK